MKLKDSSMNPQQLDDLFAPLPLNIVYHPDARGATSTAEKIAAAAFIMLTCLGVFLGMASFFAGITGEKSMRVTEQVIAAISPQTWVDGKLLGLTAAAFGTLLTYGAALGLFVAILKLGIRFHNPLVGDPPTNSRSISSWLCSGCSFGIASLPPSPSRSTIPTRPRARA